jgi:hypothetical protein
MYRQRPSALLGIHDSYHAWCVDEAIYLWGSYVDSEIEKLGTESEDPKEKQRVAKAQRKREHRLRELLQTERTAVNKDPYEDEPHWADFEPGEPLPPIAPPKGKFRDPAQLMKG